MRADDGRRRAATTKATAATPKTTATTETTPWRPRRPRHPWRDTVTCVWIAMLSAAALSAAVTKFGDPVREAKINLVIVRSVADASAQTECMTTCSGLMVSQLLVLTAASCAGPAAVGAGATADVPASARNRPEIRADENTTPETTATATDGSTETPTAAEDSSETAASQDSTETTAAEDSTETTAAPTESSYKSIVKSEVPPNSITVILDGPREFNSTELRMVVEKYVHPDWNPKTHVGDLALLIIDRPFEDLKFIDFPYMIGNDKKNVPKVLSFKGNRRLFVEFSPDACLTIGNNTSNSIWWSFLCTTPQHARSEYSNTLCNVDIGGPLYAVEGSKLWLYGVHSHAYHATYPVCGERICNVWREAPYPCNTGNDSGMYYRHTAVVGRYSAWLRRVVEIDSRLSTPVATRKCPTVTLQYGASTLDPVYDVDEYDGRRSMVNNRKVCPKEGIRTSGVRRVAVSFAVTAAVVLRTVAAAVPGDRPS